MYRIPPEKIFSSFFFFFLSFFLSLFIYLFHRIVIHVILSVIRLSCSSRFFFFHFIYFYFYSILFPFVSSCPPTFSTNLCYSVSSCLYIRRSPPPTSFEKDTWKKKCIFIYCTNRSNVRKIESISREIPLASFVQRAPPPRISTKEELGFPFHIFNFFTLFSIPLSTPSNSVAPHVERDVRTLIPRIHNNALVAISYNYGRRR